MNFVGRGQRLKPQDFGAAADIINVSEAHIRAVAQVEAAGYGFIPDGRPKILFEYHWFYHYLKSNPSKLKRAIAQNLATPKSRMRPYPKTDKLVWKDFEAACEIDQDAAILSTSWGLGQIMGFNHEFAGFKNKEDMVNAFCDSEREQLFGMIRFIKSKRIDDELRKCDWRGFAYTYNGANYAKWGYHTKLASAYKNWEYRLKSKQKMEDDDGVLRVGDKGDAVKAMQEKLNSLGYHVKRDTVFGTKTRDMVLAWKADNFKELTPEMTPEDIADLNKSAPRPIAEERSEMSLKEAADSSPIIKEGGTANKVIVGTTTVVAAGKAAQETGILDQAQDAADKVQQATGIWGTIKEGILSLGLDAPLQMVADHATWILMAGGAVVFWMICKMRRMRLEMARTGETV